MYKLTYESNVVSILVCFKCFLRWSFLSFICSRRCSLNTFAMEDLILNFLLDRDLCAGMVEMFVLLGG